MESFLILAGNTHASWYLLPLALTVSLVYSATGLSLRRRSCGDRPDCSSRSGSDGGAVRGPVFALVELVNRQATRRLKRCE